MLLEQWLASLSSQERHIYKEYNSQKRRCPAKPGGPNAKVKTKAKKPESEEEEEEEDEDDEEQEKASSEADSSSEEENEDEDEDDQNNNDDDDDDDEEEENEKDAYQKRCEQRKKEYEIEMNRFICSLPAEEQQRVLAEQKMIGFKKGNTPTNATLTKAEHHLKDKSDGRPDKPPPNGYSMFCAELMSSMKDSAGSCCSRNNMRGPCGSTSNSTLSST